MEQVDKIGRPETVKLGSVRPDDCLVAVFDDTSALQSAVSELEGAGFSGDRVSTITGNEFIENYRAHEENRGLLGKAAGLFPSEEDEVMKLYLGAAENGSSLIAVYAPEEPDRDKAAAIVEREGGHSTRYYGKRTIVDLNQRRTPMQPQG